MKNQKSKIKPKKNKIYTTIIITILILLFFSIITLINKNSNNHQENLKSNLTHIFPNIKLTTTNNKTLETSNYEGKTLILQAMASWCSSCEYQAKELEKVQKMFPNVKIISIDVDTRRDTLQTLSRFKNSISANWTFALDSYNDFIKIYNIHYLDTTIIINKKGKIIFKDPQITSADKIEKILKNDN